MGSIRGANPVRPKFPLPSRQRQDKGRPAGRYRDGLGESATDEAWLASYRLASKVTTHKAYVSSGALY